MVKARSKDGHEIEQNISLFKKIPKSNGSESDVVMMSTIKISN